METKTVRERVTRETPIPRVASDAVPSVCLLGEPYWAKTLEESLNAYAGARLSAFRPRFGSWHALGDLRKILSADVLVRMGFRPGARTPRGRAFDALWAVLRLLNPRAVAVFYWLGTDVLNTTEDLQRGILRQRCYARAQRDFHLAVAPWLADELHRIGITAVFKDLASPPLARKVAGDLPARFSILTYIPDARPRFYGGDAIYRAAQRLPEVHFDVVGGQGAWIPRPLPNLTFHGWQKNMEPFYCDASVLARLVPHDGIGLTVLEALSLGRHVIYSFPLPHTLRVAWDDSDALIETLTGLFNLHQRGLLRPNAEGRAYVEEHFNFHVGIEDLISYFLEVAANRRNRRPELNGR